MLFSWRFRAVLCAGIVVLAVYQWQTGQVATLWPHLVVGILVWVPDVYARGVVRT